MLFFKQTKSNATCCLQASSLMVLTAPGVCAALTVMAGSICAKVEQQGFGIHRC